MPPRYCLPVCFDSATCARDGQSSVTDKTGVVRRCTILESRACPSCPQVTHVNPIHFTSCNGFGCDTRKPTTPARATPAQLAAFLPLAVTQYDQRLASSRGNRN